VVERQNSFINIIVLSFSYNHTNAWLIIDHLFG
jgi:hypothetical protein